MPEPAQTPPQLLDEVTLYVVTLTYMETRVRLTPKVIEQLRQRLALFAAQSKAALDEGVTLPDPEKWAHITDTRKTAPETPRARRERR